MSITVKSDKEIIDIASPMIDDSINGSNKKDWDLFTRHQTQESIDKPGHKEDIERQWEKSKFLTSLNFEREILGVLRRQDVAVICWKQTSTAVPGEYLASYHLKEIDGQIKEIGFIIN